MDILGLGTHVLDCPRVRKLLEAHADKFVRSVYTAREAAYCRDRTHCTEFYAALWATKEAVFRALGSKWRKGVNWRDVEVLCPRAIEPTVEVTGPTADRMAALGVSRVLVTFSYSRLFATATALAVRA